MAGTPWPLEQLATLNASTAAATLAPASLGTEAPGLAAAPWLGSIQAAITAGVPPLHGGGLLASLAQVAAVYYAVALVLHCVVPALLRPTSIQVAPRRDGQAWQEARNSLGAATLACYALRHAAALAKHPAFCQAYLTTDALALAPTRQGRTDPRLLCMLRSCCHEAHCRLHETNCSRWCHN